MARRRWIWAIVLVASMPIPTLAQRDGGSRGGSFGLPETGSQLPSVTAVDAEGNEFSLDNLRGKYTVLVFGCLT